MTEEFPFTKGRRRTKNRQTRQQLIDARRLLRQIDWPEITEERVERSMRVTPAEEIMDMLRCTTPGPTASTFRWHQFLAEMRVGPQTPAALRAVDEAERELLRRVEAIPTDRAQ